LLLNTVSPYRNFADEFYDTGTAVGVQPNEFQIDFQTRSTLEANQMSFNVLLLLLCRHARLVVTILVAEDTPPHKRNKIVSFERNDKEMLAYFGALLIIVIIVYVN